MSYAHSLHSLPASLSDLLHLSFLSLPHFNHQFCFWCVSLCVWVFFRLLSLCCWMAILFFSLCELITCHVPMVIIMCDDICKGNASKQERSNGWQIYSVLSKWICFWIWKMRMFYYYLMRLSLQLYHCSIHFGPSLCRMERECVCECVFSRIDFFLFLLFERIHLNDCLLNVNRKMCVFLKCTPFFVYLRACLLKRQATIIIVSL